MSEQGPVTRGECLLWTGRMHPEGYGVAAAHPKGGVVYAHREAYEAAHGPIPDGLQIDHLCRNRACVNPDHLEAVTRRENILRGISPQAQNARKDACPKGHAYSGVNSKGRRICHACRQLSDEAFRQRRYAQGLRRSRRGSERFWREAS